MENVIERLEDLRDFFVDLYSNQNVRRWTIEIVVSIVVGLLAGCFAYNALHKKDAKLQVSQEKAVAITQQAPAATEENQTSEETTEEDNSNVTITVVDPGEYVASVKDWSAEQISAAIAERSGYLDNNKYWPAVNSYWETARGVTGDGRFCTYLFETDSKVYTAADFEGVPAEVLHIAKNEIYARHGYSFRDSEIMNYFMGQIWYEPSIMPADFSEDVFTETEVKNLDLINSIDKM